MDSAELGAGILGFFVGPVSLYAWYWVFDRMYPRTDPELQTSKGQALVLFATAVASIAAGFILIGAVWAFGLYPLKGRASAFLWGFAIGALVAKAASYLWVRSRTHARDS